MAKNNQVIEDHKLNEECRYCIRQKRYGGECNGKAVLTSICILFEKA